MSEARFLILFAGDAPGWLRLADGRTVARGEEIGAIPPPDQEEEPERVLLIVPGTDVAIHWVELPETLAPAQALGAARLLASEVTAEPLSTTHIALGPTNEGEDERAMALVSIAAMEQWLAGPQALGFDPDHVVPEPMMMEPPGSGLRSFHRAGVVNMRGERRAFAAERELAKLLAGDDGVEAIDTAAFENGLIALAADPPIDLRQGVFAKRRRWKVDWNLVRRLALVAGGILIVTLCIQLALIMRYSFAADALERQARQRALEALPGVTAVADPVVQLRERLVTVGGGPGYSAIAGAIFGAVRNTEGAELQSLIYSSDGTAQVAIAAATPAGAASFQQQLTESGVSVTPGATRTAGSRQIAEFVVRAP